MLLFALPLILANETLPLFYISDPEVASIASKLLIIAAIFQLADGLQATSVGVLRGLTDVRIPLIITFSSYWIIAVPLGYYLGIVLNMGAVGIWTGLCIGLFLVAISCVTRFNIKSKEELMKNEGHA